MKLLFIGTWLAGLLGSPVADPRVEDRDLDFVVIREPNNPADENGYGSVAYAYRITREQIGNEHYVKFLNAVDTEGTNGKALYRSEMTSSPDGGILLNPSARSGRKYAVKPGFADKPVVFVDWRDAARFANWMRNGGRKGSSTEVGSYSLRESDRPGQNRHGKYWVPNEHEIYKAGFYLPLGRGGSGTEVLYSRISPDGEVVTTDGAVPLRVMSGWIPEVVDPAADPPVLKNAAVIFAGRADPEGENGRVGFRLTATLTGELAEEPEAHGDSYAGAPDGPAVTPVSFGGFGSGAGGSGRPGSLMEPPPAS